MNIEDDIEAIARQLVEQIGKNPDAKVTMNVLPIGGSPHGPFSYLPPDYAITPLWCLYREMAKVVIRLRDERA